MALEESGLKLVLEGLDKTLKGLRDYQSELTRIGGAEKVATKTTGQIGKAFDATTGGAKGLSSLLPKLTGGLNALSTASGGTIPAMSGLTGGMSALSGTTAMFTPQMVMAGAAIAGFAVAAAGAFALLRRGAALEPIVAAFGNIMGGGEAASAALQQMRVDTNYATSDINLMRLSVKALQGTTGEFRTIVGQNFGAVLEGVESIAQSTGQASETVQEKFIRALRTATPRALAAMGIIVDSAVAYQRYAEANNLAANSLTKTQQRAAFATEAIRQLGIVTEETGEADRTLDLLEVPLVTITNLLDKLSLAIQPAFAPLLEVVSAASVGLQNIASVLFPMIQAGARAVGAAFNAGFALAKAAVNAVLAPLLALAGEVLPYVIAAASLIFDAVSAGFNALAGVFSRAADSIKGFWEGIFGKIDFSKLAFKMAEGGGYIIGSFAAGLARGGSYVVIAVTKIAQIVADFLQGFSPPKMGPLKDIDKGGMAVARAWAEGFSQGLIDPVETVVAEVDAVLGEIGGFSKAQIETRLGELDEALRPFQERLSITKADVESIAGYIDPALNVLERQQKSLVTAFAQGKVDAEQVRAIDRRIVSMQQLKGEEQDRLDTAQAQFALISMTQTRERALLQIAQGRLKTETETAVVMAAAAETVGGGAGAAVKDMAEESAKAAKEAAGGGTGGEVEEPLDLTGGKDPFAFLDDPRIDAAKEVLSEGFAQGIAESGVLGEVANLENNIGELKTQLNRIKEADPVTKLKAKFAGLTNILDAPISAITGAWSGLFGTLESIASTGINALSSTTGTALATVLTAFDNVMGSAGIQNIINTAGTVLTTFQSTLTTVSDSVSASLAPMKAAFSDTFGSLGLDIGTIISDETGLGSIITKLSNLAMGLPATLGLITPLLEGVFGSEGVLQAGLRALVSPEGFLGEEGALVTAIDFLFAPGGAVEVALTSVSTAFNSMLTSIEATGSNLITTLTDLFKTPIHDLRTEVSDTLTVMGTLVRDWVSNTLPSALGNLVTTLNQSLINPFIGALNSILDALDSALNDALGAVPGFIRDMAGLPERITVGRIPTFAEGGTAGKGLALVGERGAELVNFGSPAQIIPAGLTRDILAQAAGMTIGGGGSSSSQTINRQRTFNNTFNMQQASQPLAMLRHMEANLR